MNQQLRTHLSLTQPSLEGQVQHKQDKQQVNQSISTKDVEHMRHCTTPNNLSVKQR